MTKSPIEQIKELNLQTESKSAWVIVGSECGVLDMPDDTYNALVKALGKSNDSDSE